MDIKPQNVLVRSVGGTDTYKIYIANFGTAGSYSSLEDSETEGYTLFTRKYSAPEVVDGLTRGLSADSFSLGCVFLEIAAALARAWSSLAAVSSHESESYWDRIRHVNDLLASNEYGDTSYQANIKPLQMLLGVLETEDQRSSHSLQHIWGIISQMIAERPAKRPLAESVAEICAHRRGCCRAGPESLEATRNTLQ